MLEGGGGGVTSRRDASAALAFGRATWQVKWPAGTNKPAAYNWVGDGRVCDGVCMRVGERTERTAEITVRRVLFILLLGVNVVYDCTCLHMHV